MDEPLTQSIPITEGGRVRPTLWTWYADIPDTITAIFVDGRIVTPWRVPVEVLAGVPHEGMTIVYLGDEALISLDGVNPDGSDFSMVLHASAQRLEQFHRDIQSAVVRA